MSSGGFDRVRPRAARPRDAAAAGHDPQGKRALFSAGPVAADRPGPGSVTVDCPVCGERSVLSPVQALRAAFPSLLLGAQLTRGDRSRRIGLGPERAAWLRCPTCRRRRWVTLTVSL